MAGQDSQYVQAVAYITFRMAAREEDCAIFPNDQFDIGRRLVQDFLGVKDRSVSVHHIRIHCVVYEDDEEHRVAPLVYLRVLSKNAVILRRNDLDGQYDGIDVGSRHGDILLNSGDHVQLTTQISFSFTAVTETYPPRLDKVRMAEVERFSHRYRLSSRVLGVGGYAAVYVAVKQSTGQQFACKVVSLPVQNPDDDLVRVAHATDPELEKKQNTVAMEYNVLKGLSHPNIIALEKVFRTSHTVFLFQELITGGDLLSYLDNKGRLSEPQAAIIVRQLLEAVKYLHANQVVHRDIKPENILMTSWRDGARIVLTDFGQSRTITDLETAAKKAGVFRMQSIVGTYGYTAPEVYHQMKRDLQDGSGYSQAVDIWSIGCVTGTLLTNDFIFPDGKELRGGSATMSQFARHLEVLDSGKEWAHVGHTAKSFVRGCLATDADVRLTAAECLQLPWFQHQHYRSEFDALYQRAIQDWNPKVPDDKIIEVLDTGDIAKLNFLGEARSHHIPAPKPTALTPAHGSPAGMDSTLGRFRTDADLAVPRPIVDAALFTQLDDMSPIPAPPSLPSARSINRAKALQRQYVQESMFETQSLLPPPPKFSRFGSAVP